jgi:threonylcarbamoyladenosine tRNA methylthiotransferase CDKAL1
MADIEDIQVDVRPENEAKSSVILPKKTKKARERRVVANKEQREIVPGTQTVFFKTWGCGHNASDGEYMLGLLVDYGFQTVNNIEEADIVVLNSCTVKNPSESSFMNRVNEAKELGIPVVASGCVPQADRKIKGLDGVSVVGISQIDRIVEVVEETLRGNVVRLLAKKSLPRLDLPKIRKSPLIEILPLSTGCLGSCTYCKTKHARGKLGSYDPAAIISRARRVVQEEGVTEVWLSSEDTGAYGLDINTNLSELFSSLSHSLPANVMLRLGMTNPPFILNQLEAIADILNRPNVYAFLHIPVQSGSNAVLEAMNREYTVEEFRQVVDFLLERVPDLHLSTDIICGFPTETEEDFDETMQLVADYGFSSLNISQFYPRPGTPAAKMKRIPTQIVKDRSRKLTRLFRGFDPLAPLKGRVEKVWFGTEISEDGDHTVGHSKSYVKVLVPKDDALIGQTAEVEFLDTARFHVWGQEVPNTREPIETHTLPPLVNECVRATPQKPLDEEDLILEDEEEEEKQEGGKEGEGALPLTTTTSSSAFLSLGKMSGYLALLAGFSLVLFGVLRQSRWFKK